MRVRAEWGRMYVSDGSGREVVFEKPFPRVRVFDAESGEEHRYCCYADDVTGEWEKISSRNGRMVFDKNRQPFKVRGRGRLRIVIEGYDSTLLLPLSPDNRQERQQTT